MLEYFSYKKFKKNKAEKEDKDKDKPDGDKSPKPVDQEPAAAKEKSDGKKPAKDDDDSSSRRHHGKHLLHRDGDDHSAPVLDDADERFLRSIIAESDDEHADEGPKPPLPPRISTPELTWTYSNDSRLSHDFRAIKSRDDKSAAKTKTKDKDKDADESKKKTGRLSFLFGGGSKKHDKQLALPNANAVAPPEADRERHDVTKVLDDLNLSAQNNKAFSLNAESSKMVRDFTNVLRDLINGVPTAADDLVALIQDRDGALSRNFDKLPSSLKKIVTQLPDKVTGALGPEIMAAAAASQGIKPDDAKKGSKHVFTPGNLMDLVTKPGAVVGMLKAIVNALKLRWPAFIGTNVIWSVAVFLLLFVLWYCHKRGREVRLEQERQDEEPIDGSSRIEELPDDPQLPSTSSDPNAPSGSSQQRIIVDPPREDVEARNLTAAGMPPPPIGEHAPPSSGSSPGPK